MLSDNGGKTFYYSFMNGKTLLIYNFRAQGKLLAAFISKLADLFPAGVISWVRRRLLHKSKHSLLHVGTGQ